MILFSATQTFWGFFGAMAIYTFGELSSTGIQQSFVSKLAPEQMRGQYFAASSLRWTFSRMVAPLFIPMTVWIGYGWTFFVLAMLALLSAGLYGLLYYIFEKASVPSIKKFVE